MIEESIVVVLGKSRLLFGSAPAREVTAVGERNAERRVLQKLIWYLMLMKLITWRFKGIHVKACKIELCFFEVFGLHFSDQSCAI